MRISPIILAGGTGTRLWPVSRRAMPKQFLPLIGTQSTFQAALERVGDPDLFQKPIVITNDDYRFHVRSQVEDMGLDTAILLEPVARDSAPAIAAAAGFARRRDGEETVVLILAADHVVLDDAQFVETCMKGLAAARDGRIVTFGIAPTEPKTGYGYIRPAALRGDVCDVAAFVEKPDAATAARYIAEGCLWNSGNFMARADILDAEFAEHAPGVWEPVERALDGAETDLGFVRLARDAFSSADRISFDYAVMEATGRAAVVRADYRWSDIGSWDAIWEISDRDDRGNVVRGDAELIETQDTIVHADHGVVGAVGVRDLVISATSDAVLVADRAHSAQVKMLVERLAERACAAATEHPLVRRPWGSYTTLDAGERFVVKKIVVRPGAALSLQRHANRAEHWIVVRGIVQVTIGDDVFDLIENQSTYIPPGSVHRLANRGETAAEIIEVRTGTYLEEDDIERLQDDYGRA